MTTETPIDMVLHCPACGTQHIDAPEPYHAPICNISCGMPAKGCSCGKWDNPPHKSHLCHGCGHIWRPADVPTNGVRAVMTIGKADSPVHTCRAGHQHKWVDVLGTIGSKCKHCGDAIPF